MHYFEVNKARAMAGLRLVLTCGVPGPWGESAKKIFEYKGVRFVPVAQHAGRENADLVDWTGVRNAPIAVYENEPPRSHWIDILMLGERLAPQRPLLPASSEDRALVIGISAELCGEWGFGWARRTMMGAPQLLNPKTAPPPAPFTADEYGRMRQSYSVSVGGPEEADPRAADILRMLAKRLHAQKKEGSPYFVGSAITACDIYWTVFSMALEPLPDAVNPMPDWMRWGYELIGPTLEAAKDPILLEHRDMIYKRHLKLPLEF